MNDRKIITPTAPNVAKFLMPNSMFKDLYKIRDLIFQFTRREILLRYKGTYLGWIWSVLNPLVTLGVYTFVFGYILRARFTDLESSGQGQYALTLFCGIIVYNIFSGCISRAPQLITSKPNYVKKVVFPLEILPIAALGSSLVHASFGFLILVPALFVFSPQLSATIYLFPLILIPLCALTVGIGWFLASLGVFIRDFGQVITILLQLLFFLSAVIYPISAIPETFQLLARLNPLITIIENARRTLIWGQPIEWGWWIFVTLASLLFMQLGYFWFMKSKRSFSDFL